MALEIFRKFLMQGSMPCVFHTFTDCLIGGGKRE